MGVLVGVAVAAACIDTVVFWAVQLQATHLVIADHVGPDLVAVHRVGVVDHIGCVTTSGAHVDFQCHIVTLFAQAQLILVQLEELAVEEPALGAKRLDGAEADVFQRGGHGFLRPVA